MALIRELAYERRFTNPETGTLDLEALRQAGHRRAEQEAAARTIYVSEAIELLDEYRQFEVDAEEVAQALAHDPKQVGDWRVVVTTAARLTYEVVLNDEILTDVSRLRVAVHEAETKGFTAVAIHERCLHEWAGPGDQTNWSTGVLNRWGHIQRGRDGFLLRVLLSDGQPVWLELVQDTSEGAT